MSGGINALDSMLAAQIVEVNTPYKIHDIPTPKDLGPNDLLIKVAVASYCHTDSMVAAGLMGTRLPAVGSHEGAGTVVESGSDVHGFKAGDRVMVPIIYGRCGDCHDCNGPEDYRQYCPNLKGHLGVTLDGAFAEYMVADARETCLLPEQVDFETAAPLACAGCTIWRALTQTGLERGQTVGLVGAGGGLGHLGCQFAKAMGFRVIGIDARDDALTLAKDCGADLILDARLGKDEVVAKIRDATAGRGVDAAVTISDHPTAAGLACAITATHGTMVQVAQPPDVSIPFRELVFRDIRVRGSLICAKHEAQQMLRTVAKENIRVRTNLFFGLKEIPKLLDLVHKGALVGKGVVVIDEAEQRRLSNHLT